MNNNKDIYIFIKMTKQNKNKNQTFKLIYIQLIELSHLIRTEINYKTVSARMLLLF